MVLIKTEKFNTKFLYDLADIVIYKKEYLASLEKFKNKEGSLLEIKPKNQPSSKVKLFGSYIDKKIGEHISDIDIIFILNNLQDDAIYLGLNRIFKYLKDPKQNKFKYLRFYCGNIKGLELPWDILESGSCNFHITTFKLWIENLNKNHNHLYKLVKDYIDKDTLSMLDIIKISKILEPYISLNWTLDELISGYKIHNGIKYFFRECMQTYTRHSRVIKLMYTYREGPKPESCLVDINFATKDKSIKRDHIDIVSYYIDDIYKKYKYLKKMLPKEIEGEFLKERKEAIGQLRALSSIKELIDKAQKYNIDKKIIYSFENDAKQYARSIGIENKDYNSIQMLITEKIIPLYEKYKYSIRDEYKKPMYMIDIRRREVETQVPLEVLKKRESLGYDCSLFAIETWQINLLYEKASNLNLDPYKLYECLVEMSKESKESIVEIINKNISKEDYKIVEEDNKKFILYRDESKISESNNLVELQIKALFVNVSEFKPVKKIGQSYLSEIWIVEKDKKEYIMKVLSYKNDSEKKIFLNELRIMNIFSPLNICPKLYAFSENSDILPNMKDNYGVIIMEKMDGDLTFMINKNIFREDIARNARKQLFEKYNIMKNRGYLHNDIHDGNILFKKYGNNIEWYFGDMDIVRLDEFIASEQRKGREPVNSLKKEQEILKNTLDSAEKGESVRPK